MVALGVLLALGGIVPQAGANVLKGELPFPYSLDDAAPPAAMLDSMATDSGLRLRVSVDSNRCWAAAPPCTPHPALNLRPRGQDLGHGFRVEGEWKAMRWPNPWIDFLGMGRRR